MTKKSDPPEPTTIVYAMYFRNPQTGHDSYFTELAINKAFIDNGTLGDIAAADGNKYFTDPSGTIVIISPTKTIVFKEKGYY